MAALAARAPLVTLRRVACAVGRGVGCASAPTWPEGAKGRQPAPRRTTFPWWPARCGPTARRLTLADLLRGAPACRLASSVRRAPRALEVVEKVVTMEAREGEP